jgi:hypothetical protein
LTSPTDPGSGGGGSTQIQGRPGGAGGGAIRLTVAGVLQVDGRISAAGAAAPNASGGGGSGGSIYLSAGTLAGSGVIAADGGAGNSLGGGGGGGRVAILYGTNSFSGLASAYGGSGYIPGGAGTIYTLASNQSWGQVVVDNGGLAGTNTSFGDSAAGTVDLTVRNGAVLIPPSSQTLGTLVVGSNGWVLVSSQALTVTGNATLQAGGGIIADGTGYLGGMGPGAGRFYTVGSIVVGGGGGYGGYGAAGSNSYGASGGTAYGSVTYPADQGSGGGGYATSSFLGGAGGGSIRLTVAGVLEVNGRISARGLGGGSPSAGGGAGGSINLTVGTLSGSGVISANGGAGNALGGGGGGGRIAIVYSLENSFSGLVSAYGGGGGAKGGAGTIYTKPTSSSQGSALLVLDNGGQIGTNSGWPSAGVIDVTVRNGACLAMPGSSQTIGNLLLGSNGWLYVTGAAGIGSATLNVSGNAIVQAGGGIIADGGGYSLSNGGSGPGAGGYANMSSGNYCSGGGGFGGFGAASGGDKTAAGGRSVGLVSAGGPGSAGGSYNTTSVAGGPGGGAINLNVSGTLQVSGSISSAGGAGLSPNAGGGSGGGITLTVGTLAGAGLIAANGGSGVGLGGGGGGGRIVINYNNWGFGGVMTAYGGGGYAWGGAGTIYTKASRQSWGQVVADNGGHAGTNTSWSPGGTVDLTVTGGAVVLPQPAQTFGTLLVASNGWVSLSNQVLTVTSNATIEAGGGITADGTGYGGGQGPGAGNMKSGGGGGGFGGYGAASGGLSAGGGGMAYGSATTPADAGSGGGTSSANNPAGAGGGALRLDVAGSLVINGRVSANGGSATGQFTGGGSGGSVRLSAGTLAGAGTISANGGTGNGRGGGGSGGRIALNYSLSAFDGVMSAVGGGGYAWGGAGTIYTKASSQAMGQMLVDNGGHSGAGTPVAYLSPLDLTVTGGAAAYPWSSSLLLSNLFIRSGGSFTCLADQTNLDLVVLRNATIDSGGLLSVDGKGFGPTNGPGAGRSTSYIGSGAGYGGRGGASSVLPGGETYGSAQAPADRGSGGGPGWGAATPSSEGAGAIRLTLGGTLMLNGTLSANGNAGLQDSAGGGAGGSVWLTVGALAGNGVIKADGGAGELYSGGGGGGGRIAIYTPVNAFGGVLNATGGAGASPGEAGSVYYGVTLPAPQVAAFSPVGTFTSAISRAEIAFNTPVNPYSVSAANIGLIAPGGVAVSNLASTPLSPYRYHVDFPAQTAQGTYLLTVGPQVTDLSGQPMSQVYTGSFTIAWAAVRGSITDTNGLPVADVVLQPDGGVPATATDTNGNYVLGLPPAGTITVAASKAGFMFVPSSRIYSGVTSVISNENYLAVSTVAPTLTIQVQTNSYVLNWYGIPGVAYQALCSTNLMDWLPYQGVLPGTNGPLQVVVPVDTNATLFFRVDAAY